MILWADEFAALQSKLPRYLHCPGDDFFQYAIGGWLKRHAIPATEARWGIFDVLRKTVRTQLGTIAKRTAAKAISSCNPDELLVRNFWRAAMDQKRRDKLGLKPIQKTLHDINTLSDASDIQKFIAKAHLEGENVLWAPYVDRDEKQSNRNILYFVQAGLSLPDRDYYLKDDADSKNVRAAYQEYIPRLLKLAGYSAKEAGLTRDAVIRIETMLAEASMTRVERRDPHAQYNPRTIQTLTKEAPNIDWGTYLKRIGASRAKTFIVSQPKFVARASELLTRVPLDDWKAYFSWHVINGSAGVLTTRLERELFRFYATKLSGVKKMKPLWERQVSALDGSLGDALGKLYVREHFPASAKRRMDKLIDNLFAAYRDRLTKLPWMGAATKKKALDKLSRMKRKIGYPSKWKKYPGLVISPTDYFGNFERIHALEWKRMMNKITKKPDPTEWYMTAPTVNAYYDPGANEIAFPAGIMQPPFFDEHADDAMNYGSIGSVIGHEITHGFDDQGRKYDAKGNLKEWWTKKDAQRFKARAEVLRKQYDAFVAIDGMHVNGSLTLGENIADLGGVIIAYEAFMRSRKGKKDEQKIDGFTPEQRFFLALTLFECEHKRPEALKKTLVTDPHSPGRFRINGPLPNVDSFYRAFDVTNKDKLYRAPKTRAEIW